MFPASLRTMCARAALLGMAATACPAADALERVLLQNGFSIDCTRREEISPNRFRLFLGDSSANYIEVDSPSIVSVTMLATQPTAVTSASNTVPATVPEPLSALIANAGAEHRIRTALLASVVQAESGGHAHAVSHAGAQGLMQLMPSTARQLGVSDSFAPEENLRGGSTYLDSLLTRYHEDIPLALAAYNAGPAAVDRYHGVPPFRETRVYVARIIREFNRRVLAETASRKTGEVGASLYAAARKSPAQ